ncbi:peptide chain release factor 2 [Treponema pedis]|uniref:peptide chain release factor 2 n=1 Tax=Treponema pedis TaxID=409322 RepID=UPI0012693316|nr:peptide chain release factor 2 [Treponema pedis]
MEEYRTKLVELKNDVNGIWGRLDPVAINAKIAEKEALTLAAGFWNDTKKAEMTMGEIKALKNRIEPWKALIDEIADLEVLIELLDESGDINTAKEVETSYNELYEKYRKLNTLNLLSGEVDKNHAFLTLHAGAGGTEACDWASMLVRMYLRWCEAHNFKAETIDLIEAEGGIKSVTFQITGEYAFGLLKCETGIHRLVRISPFDSNGKRHTSFTSVFVFPVLDDTIDVDIRPEDLRIDTYRSGGAGGQHVNKTDSAVRITHLPTGIVVACQSQRSQISNRTTAMNVLKARLYNYYEEQKEKENMKFAAEKKDISWGNQIRSYVFQPYTMVKDHRTKYETGNIQAVMNGEIDEFINVFLNTKLENR